VIAKRAPVLGNKNTATSNTAAPNATKARLSAEQMDLGEGWSHVVRGGVFSKPPLHLQVQILNRSRRLPSHRK
jgi:hypothetical protein